MTKIQNIKQLHHVLVINSSYICDLGFICYLMLEIWDLAFTTYLKVLRFKGIFH